MLISSTAEGTPQDITDADGFFCVQAWLAAHGGGGTWDDTLTVWDDPVVTWTGAGATDLDTVLHCGQAWLARDDPDSVLIHCGQAVLAARFRHGPPAWWGDPLADWGDPTYGWGGGSVEAPIPQEDP
jgi:hypothetical protein